MERSNNTAFDRLNALLVRVAQLQERVAEEAAQLAAVEEEICALCREAGITDHAHAGYRVREVHSVRVHDPEGLMAAAPELVTAVQVVRYDVQHPRLRALLKSSQRASVLPFVEEVTTLRVERDRRVTMREASHGRGTEGDVM